MITSDFHMHSYYSGDSTASMKEMIEGALLHGMTKICFTDHMDYDYPSEGNLTFEFDVTQYVNEIKQLKQQYHKKIQIYTGIELGLQPYLANRYDKLISSHSFDFVIGSSHLIDKMDPYFPTYWNHKDEYTGYTAYFQTILDNIASHTCFDSYGHIDYIVRYGPNRNNDYSYELYQEILDRILRALISSQKALEINTSGYKYGLQAPHPQTDVIKRYLALGGELITIGSDAHKPEHIAYDFVTASHLLKEIGFRYYATYIKRKPIMELL